MRKLLILLTFTVLCLACSKEEYSLGDIPSNENTDYSVTPEKEHPNIIRFRFNEQGVSPFWKIRKPDGSYVESSSRDFTLRYYMKGEYDGTLQVYGGGGASEPVAFTFHVTENDPVVALLTGTGEQKVWEWNYSADNHFGEGSSSTRIPDWWPVKANELKDMKMYDDELSFITDTWQYVLDAKGYVYADGSVLSDLDPQNYPEGGTYSSATIAYTQPEGQKWALYADEAGTLWLSFTEGGFPSYAPYPDGLGGAYEVMELTEETLALRFDTGSDKYGAWYYRFVVKGSQPDADLLALEQLLTTKSDGTQKIWTWDYTRDGHFGEGDLASREPDWWPAGANEMRNYSMYDDELSFLATGKAYELAANGYVYCDAGARAAMGLEEGPTGDIAYTQPAGQTWKIEMREGVPYLCFSEMAFPSAVCHPSALGGSFEILSLTADELYLRLATDVDAWYFRFVPKPEAEPEPEPSELEKRLTTSADGSQKVWVWDYTRDGYFGEGDLSARDPNWWAPPMDEMSIYSMFDDELTFRFEGNVYGLSANGAVYCDASAREAMGLEAGKTGDIAYTQSEGQTWKIEDRSGTPYLVFSEMAFPSAICHPSALGGSFEIMALTDDELYLRLATDVDAWYFRFTVKK